MENAELAELAVFASVARHLSFRQAATERGTSASAVSHSIRSLEGRVGVRLFHRTTRSVSLTEAGEALHARLQPALADMRSALDGLNSFRATPFGTIRLNVPNSIAPYVLGDAMELLAANSGLKLEIVATDALVDIVQEGFDAGIRFGERLSQDMIAVRIKPKFRFTVVGSPSYFERKPPPMAPHDLHDHDCIRYAFPSGTTFNWEFAKEGEIVKVEVAGPLTVDSQELMADAAARGLGLAYIWEDRAAPYLHDGRLRRCLEDWCTIDESVFLYFPSRKHQSAGLRALVEIMKA
ncbi:MULTISPECIES: LysR family transcriptional regulator [Pseudomonadota]|uniref:LysR family transcriptional regulator n=1 Tax=Pseudomonadota TaxID=1224 RepID=UPI001F5DF40F|nr:MULTISPECIES: LysR family transcriptional regulator [Pseudomonadota]MCI3204060.1 LysR family transcriptional regulator [Pandoraea sp. LA3]MDN4582086.1 LysR family transcriptional regulator [Pandoraea capi]UPG95902.1 LysR family transcriptional regulator [Luteibacter aegosomatissinici]